MPSLPRRPLFWLFAGVIVLAVAAAIYLRLRPVTVDAITVADAPLIRSLQFSGRVQTPARVEVGATITGRVAKVRVRDGDLITAGQPLIELESDELRAALLQAQANLKQADARRASQAGLARPQAQAGVLQAQATLDAAQRELERTQQLVEQHFVSAAKLDEARRAVEVARAQRDAAAAAQQANREQGAEALNADAARASAVAAVEVAQAKLTQAVIKAPASGRVLLRAVEAGQIVQPGKALLTLAVDGPTELIALVDERFLAQLQVGQKARVAADAYPDQPFSARITRLGAGVDAQRGAVEVRLGLGLDDVAGSAGSAGVAGDGRAGTAGPGAALPAFLREDMTLSIEVITGERTSAKVLPLRVLRSSQGDRGVVLVEQDGRVAQRDVRLGMRTLDRVEVLGDAAQAPLTVLLDPSLTLGAKIKVRTLDPKDPRSGLARGNSADDTSSAVTGSFSR